MAALRSTAAGPAVGLATRSRDACSLASSVSLTRGCSTEALASRANASRPASSSLRCRAVAEAAPAAPAMDPVLQDQLKRAVAAKAIELIKPGSVVGIGTGSTSCIAIEEFAKAVNAGKLKNVELLVTSFQASVIARQNNLKTTILNNVNKIDVAIDGADEVDASMNLIKGGGAAHTLEKVVLTMAKETIIIVDETKIVSKLGVSFPVPVEVLPQAVAPVLRSLVAIGAVPEIRAALMKDGAIITDLGNMIVDVRFPGGIDDPAALEAAINNIPGVVENGLFCSNIQKVLVSTKDGDEITVVELADFVKSWKSLKA